MIGQDVDKNQYWVYKEDLSCIYVKNHKTGEWGVYDNELLIN